MLNLGSFDLYKNTHTNILGNGSDEVKYFGSNGEITVSQGVEVGILGIGKEFTGYIEGGYDMSTVTQKISIIFPFLKGEASFYPTKLSEIKLQSGIGAAAGFGIEYGVNYGLKLKN